MNFRERIEQAREKQNDPLAANNNQADENGFDSEYFGIDNIKSFPATLDLRLANGVRKALPYSYIMELNFDPSQGIEITTSTKNITISGRNLEKLFDYLTAFRVRYIQVNVGADHVDRGLFVKAILISDLR